MGKLESSCNTICKTRFFFVKFNFSHNGCTVDSPEEFIDLNAFAENNYTKELDDLQSVIDYLVTSSDFKKEIDVNNISLIGHSRGGGIVIIKSAVEKRITKLITWASICDFEKRSVTTGNLEQWKKDGVKYVLNGRTQQLMPHNIQFYEDFKLNEIRLHIKTAVEKINIPYLIIHGIADNSIKFSEAENLHSWNKNSILTSIDGANHVFGASHPWKKEQLAKHLQETVDKTISFIKN